MKYEIDSQNGANGKIMVGEECLNPITWEIIFKLLLFLIPSYLFIFMGFLIGLKYKDVEDLKFFDIVDVDLFSKTGVIISFYIILLMTIFGFLIIPLFSQESMISTTMYTDIVVYPIALILFIVVSYLGIYSALIVVRRSKTNNNQ